MKIEKNVILNTFKHFNMNFYVIAFIALVAWLRFYNPKVSRITLYDDKNLIIINQEITKNYTFSIIEKMKLFEQNETIKLFFNSPGGDVASGYNLILYMENAKKNNITFECYALCAHSIAFDIFQRCDLRYTVFETWLMQHDISIKNNTLENIISMMEAGHLKELKKINDELDKYAADKAGMNFNVYKEKIKKEYHLRGDDIFKQGFSDAVVVIDDLMFFTEKY